MGAGPGFGNCTVKFHQICQALRLGPISFPISTKLLEFLLEVSLDPSGFKSSFVTFCWIHRALINLRVEWTLPGIRPP